MKKLTLSLFSLLCLSTAAFAAPVDRQRVSATAVEHMRGVEGKTLTVKQVIPVNGQYYIVNFAPQGWAIVSADDNARPIIGYNSTGSLNPSTMPDNMRGWLDSRGANIKRAAKERKSADPEWKSVGSRNSRATGVDVEPLIKVNWNQTPPYNQAMAAATGEKDVLVGCVAVAMSQAMSVQRYPDCLQGTAAYNSAYGRLSIDGSKEAPYDWEKILSGAGNYAEASRLMYHAGVSVRMNYGTDGSGIPSNEVYRITDGLKNNFGYSNVSYVSRNSYKGDWEQLLVNELNAGRAISYQAVDQEHGYGHAFNIDGYHSYDGYFHVNWGWGGVSNGFMSIDNLSEPSMNMFYRDQHYAVIGIGAPNRAIFSIDVPVTTIEQNMPAGTVFSQLLINDANPTSEHSITLVGEYDQATDSRKPVPFKVETGADGSTYLVTTRPLTNSPEDQTITVMITVTESKTNTSMTAGFVFHSLPQRTLEQATSLAFSRETGDFTINTKHASTYTLEGATTKSGTLTGIPAIKFNKSDLKDGENKLTIKWDNQTKSIIIRK